jgi:hypothetical protein
MEIRAIEALDKDNRLPLPLPIDADKHGKTAAAAHAVNSVTYTLAASNGTQCGYCNSTCVPFSKSHWSRRNLKRNVKVCVKKKYFTILKNCMPVIFVAVWDIVGCAWLPRVFY